MKLFLSSFIFSFIFAWSVVGQEVKETYVVKVGGIKIGELNWQTKIGGGEYLSRLDLKSKGLLSAIYSFRGEYLSEG